MKVSARIENQQGNHHVTLKTNDATHSIDIPPKTNGFGSSVNGGELLFLALATCYCNDLYREAAQRGITVERVEVEVQGEFAAEGEPARNITYMVKVAAQSSDAEIRDLMQQTDRVAEIQNTVRGQVQVTLSDVEVLRE